MNWKKIFYTEDGSEATEQAKSEPQSQPQTKVEPLVTSQPAQQAYTPNAVFNQTGTGNVFQTGSNSFASPAVAPPAEEMQKWQNYFNALLKSARETNPAYNQFLDMIDTVSDGDPNQPLSTKIKLAFAFLKKQSVTKDTLLQAMQTALAGVKADRTTTFAEKQQKKTKEGIEDNVVTINTKNKLISDKEEEIKKLKDEISQLETKIEETKSNLNIRTACYDTLSTQLITKISDDIAGATNYIV